MIDQVPFGAASFAENPEPRAPCVLLLDISGSMAGAPLAQLAAGLRTYKDATAADALAAQRVEVAVVTFGNGQVRTAWDFTTVDAFVPPLLTADGDTPMGAALTHGIALLRQRKELYKAHGISYFRPWLFLITDGAPTDAWQAAAMELQEGERSKSFLFFAVGVEGANFEVLRLLCPEREPLKLHGLRFQDLFLWLSHSQAAVSRSSPGAAISLTDPTGPRGWATTA